MAQEEISRRGVLGLAALSVIPSKWKEDDMPFKGLLVGRGLLLIGSSGTKIKGIVEVDGVPQFQFFTGSPDETAPGILSMNLNTVPNPDSVDLYLKSPAITGVDPAVLTLRTQAGGAQAGINTNGNGSFSLVDDDLGPYAIFDPDNIQLGAGAPVPVDIDGDLNVDGQLDVGGNGNLANLILGTSNGRRINGIGGNNGAQANCSGGNGTLDFPHDFGTNNISIIPVRQGAANQIMSRITAGDTSTTFQCRVQNNDGTSPANGTTITISWIGISWA